MVFKFIKTPIFTQKSKNYNSGFDTIIKSEWSYIRLNNHFTVIRCWCHVSVAANGFQKFAISPLKTKVLPNFNTTAPLCKCNSGDSRNFNILSHHSYNHFPFYWWGGVIGQFSLFFALPLLLRRKMRGGSRRRKFSRLCKWWISLKPILMFLCILFYRNKQILKTLGQYEKGFVIVSTRENIRLIARASLCNWCTSWCTLNFV